MACWLKPDGRILCAAFNGYEPGDQYVDDGLHYDLHHDGFLYTENEGDTWQLAEGFVLPDLTEATARRLADGIP